MKRSNSLRFTSFFVPTLITKGQLGALKSLSRRFCPMLLNAAASGIVSTIFSDTLTIGLFSLFSFIFCPPLQSGKKIATRIIIVTHNHRMATDIMTVFNSVSPYVFFCSVIMCCSDGQAGYASSGILLICQQKSVLFPIKLNHYIVVFSSPIVAYQHKSHINFMRDITNRIGKVHCIYSGASLSSPP